MKLFKSILSLFALCAMAFSFAACAPSSEKQEVLSQLDQIRSELPRDLGNGTTFTDVSIKDDKVVFTFEVDQYVPLEIINNNPELRKMMIKGLKEDKDFKKNFEEITASKLGLVLEFKDRNSGKSSQLSFEPDEL